MRGSAKPNFARSSSCTMRKRPFQRSGSDGGRDVRQRQMGGRQRHTQFRAGQHHHDIRMTLCGEELGVPAEGNAGIVDGRFLQWRGDDRGVAAVPATFGRFRQRGEHMPGVVRIGTSRNFLDGQRDMTNAHGPWCTCIGSLASIVVDQVELHAATRGGALKQITIGDRNEIGRQRCGGQSDKQLGTDSRRLACSQGEPW
jgi:hypothetical protein